MVDPFERANKPQPFFDRELAREVLRSVASAVAIAAVFYILVAVFGFKFPKGHQVSPGSAI